MRLLVLALAILFLASQPASAFRIHRKDLSAHAPNPITHLQHMPFLTGYALGIPFCGATGLMLTTAIRGRQLTVSEAWQVVASCVIPVVGGLIVKHYLKKWDVQEPIPEPVDRFGIASQS